MKITVVGAGAWGSTLAELAKGNGHQVEIWSRRSSTSLEDVIKNAEIIVSAISMKGVRSVMAQLQTCAIAPNAILVTATKGLDPDSGSNVDLPLLPSQVWRTGFPAQRISSSKLQKDSPTQVLRIAILSGPNLSKEIEQGLPAASVIASDQPETAERVQAAFSSSRFRVYTNSDAIGVELGGALKNVIAIAVGACDGLELGDNAKAALITRGLAEMIRIGTYWGAKAETLYGLSGLGDLLATCNSPLSRNYQVGYGLAQGKTLCQVLEALEGTAEGINTTAVLIKLAQQQGISMPISQQVYRLLQDEITPQAAVGELMQRDSKPEV
ncbi:MAG: NAD(P)H-dependent glycerol-3-phosphate dehydrogenase [Myxacorys chilensis ATA2-1-KO14]|nr:NAD(P)H-dependent glycerol-3-phosphate dehydrogenase [Myxacorys chilensis ATA2-1-KO14]